MGARLERTRVYVADDHPLYREGVVRAIKERPEFELVGSTGDGRPALEDDRPVLTRREQEVLTYLADGSSAPQIAEKLYLSTTTVKTHLANLYGKLGVSDRAAAVAEAMRRGLLE